MIDQNRASFYLASSRPFADGNARSNAAIYDVDIFSVQRTSFCNPRASTETDPEQSAIAQHLLRDILELPIGRDILELPIGAYTDVDRSEERMEKVALLVADKRLQECLQEHTATMLGSRTPD